MPQTQSEFIKAYCERSQISEEKLNQSGKFSVVCDCGDDVCDGWAMVTRSTIQDHLQFSINAKVG